VKKTRSQFAGIAVSTLFNVGEVFSEHQANAALMQCWVASRHALALQRAFLTDNTPAVVQHEQFLHMFLAITATLKEAADAFRSADGHKCFQALPDELSADLELARLECGKTDNKSLYCRLLRPLRDKTGAHFKQDSLTRGLRDLKQVEMELRIGGTTFFDSTYPLATALLEKVLEEHGVTPEHAQVEFPKIIKLGKSLQKLSDAAVIIAVERVRGI
jgi:hypothetical protein